MSKDLNNSAEQNSPNINEDDTEKSLVGKFKSIISNTPLSKWFRRQDDTSRSTIRRREEEDDEEIDDEIVQMQPPAKRAKFPNSVTGTNFTYLSSNSISENSFISEKLIHKAYNYFPEPVAGPSGLNSQKLLNSVNNPISSARNTFSSDLLNGHKDSDSEESTSGYSSVARIGSKEHVSHSEGSSKQPSPLQTNSPNTRSLFQSPVVSTNRSLFSERTTSPKLNTSLSLRRPSFNASTFGSPNFVDKTISTEKIINSPFYNGTTIYGGASAYGRKFGRSSKDLRASLRKSIHIKPVNKAREGGNQVLGKTARKILETLEQYSTPVNDAKKIPVASKRFRPDSSLLGIHVGVNPYAPRTDSPSNRELQVPTVSDLLKMKQKAKLQSSTEAVRQIATSSQSDLKAASPQSVVHISDKNKKTPEKSDGLEKSKEKTKTKTKDSTQPQLSSGLPKFDLNIPATVTKKTEKVVDKPTVLPTSKPQNVLESRANVETNKNFQIDLPIGNNLQFKFSNPLIIAENLKCIVAMNNFKFSDPLSNWNKTDTNSSIVTPFVKPIKEKNNGQNINKDPALLNKFKPATGTWECSTCLIRNQADKTKCVACEAPNPKLKPAQPETKKPLTSFGDKFKMSDGMWACPVCMIRNSNDSAKCIACETANPKSPTLVSSSSSFQAKFKPPADSWECSTCLIRNKEELLKCAACETPKITKPPAVNQLANSFKMKEDQWECTVCLVRNQSDHAKCQCCEASKPGASSNVIVQETQTKPAPKFNFGIDQKAAALFSFGIPPATKKPSPPKPAVEPVAAVAAVLGDTAKTSSVTPTPTFSFGVIPKAQEKEKPIEAPKPAENKTALPSTAVVKPVLSMQEKPEAKSVLKSTMTTIPVITTDSKESSSTKPTTAVASFDAATKPTFTFGAKFDKKVKDTTFVPPVPKFEFNKPANAASTNEVQKQPSVQPAAQVFSFGGASKPVNSSPPVFGQKKMPTLNNSLEVKTAPTFAPTTGSSLRTSVPKPVGTKPYSFTKQQGEPATKAAMFNFGQSAGSAMNPPATQQPSGFNFGSVTKAAPFNFSAGKAETATTGTPDLFGASNTAGNKNGIFTFGNGSQATVPPKTGFNFGAPSAPSTGFNFGTSPAAPAAPATAPTGGFNFTAPYDASVKPSYNFSDSPVTFAAQATDGGLAGPRKIKRAVRRTR